MAQRTEKASEVVFGVRLPRALVQRIRLHAIAEGRQIQDVVRDALLRSIPRVRVQTRKG